jgi:hypothetical protein
MNHWTIEPYSERYFALKTWTLNLWFLRVHFTAGLISFRLFGKGLNIKNVNLHPLLYSQRTSWLPLLTLGNWQVRWLA